MGAGDEILARNIKRLMKINNWQRKTLVIESGLSDSTVGYLLNAERGATIATLRTLKKTFGCSWRSLLD